MSDLCNWKLSSNAQRLTAHSTSFNDVTGSLIMYYRSCGDGQKCAQTKITMLRMVSWCHLACGQEILAIVTFFTPQYGAPLFCDVPDFNRF